MSGVYALILAGGSGTRFWPASRRLRPKQLLSFAPDSQRPLIADAVARLGSVCPPDNVLIATGEHLLEATRRALPEVPAENFLAEPRAKNTAPCIAWGTSVIARRDPDALVCVVPSDQHITDQSAYVTALKLALKSAASGAITTLGIEPTRPETGFGYIEADPDGDAGIAGVRRVARFVEKPNEELAAQYVASGRHFWNAGMFFFRAQVMLDALARHAPEISHGLAGIAAAAARGADAERAAVAESFEAFPKISIDYAVMERETGLNVVPANVGWSDLGSWQAAWELAGKDAAGNVVSESDLAVEARGNLLLDLSKTLKRPVAVVGIDNLCVIQTDDAVLVIPREKCQDVRAVVEALQRAGRHDLL